MSMMGYEPGAATGASASGGDMSAADHLRAAIEHVQAAQVTEQDDADSQQLAKVAAQLYAVLVGRQKEQDQMLGNPGMMRALRRPA